MKTIYNLVEPKFEIRTPLDEIREWPKRIEAAGRTCYRSEDRAGDDTADKFCKRLIKNGHTSVLEHCSATVWFQCDRTTSHQLVRHRLCSFSQESQRFVDYQDRLDVVCPPSVKQSSIAAAIWGYAIEQAANAYKGLRGGIKAEDARSVLPNSAATRIVVSANVRQWRWVFHERAINQHAQHQIRYLMSGLLREFHSLAPALFDDQMRILTDQVGDVESYLAGYANTALEAENEHTVMD